MRLMKKYLPVSCLVIAALILCSGMLLRTKPDLLSYIDKSGQIKPVKNHKEWQIKRKQVLAGMQEAMGPLPQVKGLPTPKIEVKETTEFKTFTRQSIRFLAAPNEYVHALLYLPKSSQKTAAMLVLHGTGEKGKWLVDSTHANENRAVATELAYKGYVVIAPDYPSFGELQSHDFSTDRYESGTMQAVFNHIRCIDLLQSLPQVNATKIGVIGHSLGGHNALFVGAFDERLKVVVSSCGWTPFSYYNAGKSVTERHGGVLGPWAQDRYMPLLRTKFKLQENLFPFDFDEVIATIAPRTFFSNSPINDSNFDVNGVKVGIEAASKVYQFLGAPSRLQVMYPNAGHDFPIEARQEAYRIIDQVLQ